MSKPKLSAEHTVPAKTLPLLNMPPHAQITAIITCDDLVGTQTHFFHGSLIRCYDVDCRPCSEGQPTTWRGWLSIFFVGSDNHLLFSVPASDAHQIANYKDAHGSLRGCLLTATRALPEPTSKTRLQMQPADLDKIPIPPHPKLRTAIAAVIGRLQQPKPATPS